MDDRHRRGGPRLRQRSGTRADRLSAAILPAEVLERSGLVRAAFTTRVGGVSRGPYATLNLGDAVGDEPAAVSANRRCLSELLGIPPDALAEAEQVHGSAVAVLERGSGAPPRGQRAPIRGVDALATNRNGLWLAVYAADCVPVLIVDPQAPAVAAVHAGWRGTAAGIVPATLIRMREAFGTRPENCAVALGPAIGGCCYEVDAPVARAMAGAAWWANAARPTGSGKWHLDLRIAIRHQVQEAGVAAGRIMTAPFCTACRPDLFFSHRRDGITGRMAAYVSLRG